MRSRTAIALAIGLMIVGLAIYNHVQQPRPTPEPSVWHSSTLHSLAPRISVPIPAAEPELVESRTTNRIGRLLHGEEPWLDSKLSLSQIEPYLQANRRNAESLLAAFRTTGDQQFLLEAMQKHPNDPRVAYAAVFKQDLAPEEHRQWLDKFKQSDPVNALANYLSANDYFKSGLNDQALQELAAATGKSGWQDYSRDFIQNSEEAFLAAGYPEAEAKAVAVWSLPLPGLGQLKQLGQNLGNLANVYQNASDPASAQAALQLAVNLGQQFDGPERRSPDMMTTLVGMAIENHALRAMDPIAPYGDSGQTVQDRINEITQQRADLQALNRQARGLLVTMPDQDVVNYFDRMKTLGELPTMQWVINKYGQH